MKEKPIHFDGSVPVFINGKDETEFTLSLAEEIRAQLGCNPYGLMDSQK